MSQNQVSGCPAELGQFCSQRHWAIYWILIVVSVTVLAGRVMTLGKPGSPFFSANDRSRWCAICSFGEDGVFEIEDVIVQRPGGIDWNTIDKVMHRGRDGEMHAYSSKPPLMTLVLAWEYRAVKWVTGKSFESDPMFIVKIMLLLTNVIPWAIYLGMFAAFVDKIFVRDWTRYFLLMTAAFGTHLSSFIITLNNHLPAAMFVMVALYFLLKIVRSEASPAGRYFLVGMMAAAAAALELPALAFVAAVGGICLFRDVWKTALGFGPAIVLVAIAFFGSNILVHNDWRPPYLHRSDGVEFARYEVTDSRDIKFALDAGGLPMAIKALAEPRFKLAAASVGRARWAKGQAPEVDRWVVRDLAGMPFTILNRSNSKIFELHEWDNWYDYPGSYWLISNERKSKVDQGQPNAAIYAFHVLFGHHGIFSLTPVWLLALAGMIAIMFPGRVDLRWFGIMAIGLTIVVVGFYMVRPSMDRNYGGVTSALRWLFWLAPIWLVSMAPIVEWLGQKRWGRIVCFLLLGLSVLSAGYAASNPWVHPWLYAIWHLTGVAE